MMAKIYVSSTFIDLEECRRQVIHLFRRMRHDVLAMEGYTAEDQWPADKCLADVEECDLYVGLFAWRYSHIPSGSNFSITEMEYRKAIETDKPCLIFLLDEDAQWPPKYIDKDYPDRRIDKLRDEFSEKRICSFFTSAQDIASVVSPAIHNWEKKQGITKPGISIAQLDAYFAKLNERFQPLELEGGSVDFPADFFVPSVAIFRNRYV